jgi:hypothetical protein
MERDQNGRFIPGGKGGPGRPKKTTAVEASFRQLELRRDRAEWGLTMLERLNRIEPLFNSELQTIGRLLRQEIELVMRDTRTIPATSDVGSDDAGGESEAAL